MKSTLLKLSMVALLACAPTPSVAAQQEKAEPRLITVSGEAEVRVVPDEVRFDVAVQSFNKDLRQAKTQTDERIARLIEMTRRYQIAARDVQTDYFKVEPRYKGDDSSRLLIGYSVRKDLVFTLRDVSKAEALLSETLESGVTRINDVEFRTSEPRKYRDEARALAIKAAREKAIALTGEIGQKIGKAYSIEEEGAVNRGGNASTYSNVTSNTYRVEGDSSAAEGTLALGQIVLSARVVVRFEIE
ncbi:MAG TPA: SIMPL domain-containing protein [Pyrinomonadaceae bacterium]|nr:SIMPL domain-containing protein [Pyrinomonadaceae bacterium]